MSGAWWDTKKADPQPTSPYPTSMPCFPLEALSLPWNSFFPFLMSHFLSASESLGMGELTYCLTHSPSKGEDMESPTMYLSNQVSK